MSKNKACSNCFRQKKRCDRERPCQRCNELDVECEEREVFYQRPSGIAYTSTACVGCKRSKTRCGKERPCNRCVRLGVLCTDPYNRVVEDQMPTCMVTAYMAPASIKFPEPDMEVMYESLCQSMKALSPFTIADLFIDDHTLWFISTMGCLSSLIPTPKTAALARRLYDHSSLDPHEHPLALQRLSYIREPTEIPINSSSGISRIPNRSPWLKLCHLSDQEFRYYFMHVHTFNASMRYDDPPLAGVLVSIFKRDPITGNVVLNHSLSPIAETIFGYTTEQFAYISTEFGSTTDYNANEFPQSLCHFHNEDVFSYCSDSLRAFLNPGQEIEGRVRVIHSNCSFIPCNFTQLVVLYEDGGIRAVVSQFIPDSI